MIEIVKNNSVKRRSRITGIFYLLVILFGSSSEYIRSIVIVEGNVSQTVANILSSELVFRLGVLSDFVMIVCYILLAVVLHSIFTKYNRTLSLLFLLFTLASSVLLCVSTFYQFSAILLLTNEFLAWSQLDLHTHVMFSLTKHLYMYLTAQIFFGLWLLPLGYLVWKSRKFPSIIGILLMLSCFGHLIEFLIYFINPEYKSLSYPGLMVAMIGEFSFCLWLLIKGIKND
ncbi:DUF4386 domain-containing protein [Flammeovirga agarivorans]|uniref:DUF4386 domain-containing protein n=1 Tax=Flammeovirga agarivorans TaxID=2726742 RepID=A0A7X8XVL7_9BACT|nr:DUF4386 domain-containing protein [Flammeovirga agarivorans]NLR91384.1 DUF4386 domain-containing protein [Flammeovirga agarivorans]